MSEDFQLPDVLDVTPETIAAAEASLDPEVKPPADARHDKDKQNNEYWRWSEIMVIEKAELKRSPTSGLTVFFIQSKVRPNGSPDHRNAEKKVFTRYHVNFPVLAGLEQNDKHEIMNRLSMRSIASLLKATALMPDDASSKGLSGSYLKQIFPADTEVHASPLVGQIVTGVVVNAPNKRDNTRTNSVEAWLPKPEND